MKFWIHIRTVCVTWSISQKICKDTKTLDINTAIAEHDHGKKTSSSHIVLASRTRWPDNWVPWWKSQRKRSELCAWFGQSHKDLWRSRNPKHTYNQCGTWSWQNNFLIYCSWIQNQVIWQLGAMMGESEEDYQNCMCDSANHTKICKEAKTLDIHTANVEHDHSKTTSSHIFLASRTRWSDNWVP